MGKAGDFETSNVYLHTINSAPTTSKRRIQQSLALAQKLTIKQKECDELTKKVIEIEREKDSLQQELTLSKSLLGKSNQPYGYLVQTIEEKEKEVRDLKAKLHANQDEYQQLKAENTQLVHVKLVLASDLLGLCQSPKRS
jgi:progesterone-induced-blocking factor 1